MTRRFSSPAGLARWIVGELGHDLRMALPLGIGKATHVANALYAMACEDSALALHVLTALTLERPQASSELEARFMKSFADRHFDGYVELDYAKDLRRQSLPANVRVTEFFLNSGAWLSIPQAQQNYVSVNYSAAARDVIMARPINLLAQMVAIDESGPQPRYSLSGNPDVTLDILPEMEARRAGGVPFLFVAQVNRDLPFMPGSAEIDPARFDAVLDDPAVEFPIFAAPRRPVTTAEYVAGLHVASLVKDGGTLQIGIGSLGDAVTYALILRQRENALFRRLIAALTDEPRETAPFEEGLYGASEMFVDGFLELYDAGILKRRSHSGAVLHATFFVGSRDFYARLRAMPESRRADFDMTPVSFTNALYGDEAHKRADRVHARFVNNVMKADLFGAVQSDTLGDGRVVSGVGGQHDFVEQAIALRGASSILMLNATRTKNGRTHSNIVWNLERTTIPRHMRDIVVTEYGVARIKGASDADCIARMTAIADARFADDLAKQAKASGKRQVIGVETWRGNTPERLGEILAGPRERGLFRAFPFGSDFTPAEQTALKGLAVLKQAGVSKRALGRLILVGVGHRFDRAERDALQCLGIDSGLPDRFYRLLLAGAWRRAGRSSRG
ncbi:acetyl-CoA hydrolase [Novosphingobium profundi]|uniref:acetyl-CoA hydrolase/transferase C-terminal domain-containing protein n=1 Tax=Novosphingobium profundi TaxID=1774954 RepID=UPI001BD9D29A|nr:acetyl-CoA hydrolase/transferase C-terminal domain-containing protein [Novosphingobium profundi]MBT0667634.1 acetyl-CoA hydrolase [Novosphingobium profundi]